jgi:hypothetical protein
MKKSFFKHLIRSLLLVIGLILIQACISPKGDNLSESNVYHSSELINNHQTTNLNPHNAPKERKEQVLSLYHALDSKNYQEAAFFNSILAYEAFQRSYGTLKAWEKTRDPQIGLVPKSINKDKNLWNAKDNAADLFPFLLIAGKLLDKENEKLWLNIIKTEQEICGSLPCTIRIRPVSVKKERLHAQIFGASEYAKDGLLAVSERFGKGPWFDRLEEIMQAIILSAYIDTNYGKIASIDSEVNGEMLQVLSRLYWATNKPEYLQMAESIAEAYLFQILPNNDFLPPQYWDFRTNKPVPENAWIRLRDHGSEIIPGLVELYFLEKMQGKNKAQQYKENIQKLLDNILSAGRTKEGMWYSSIDNTTKKPTNQNFIDTWGYILNAYKMYDIAEETTFYSDEIQRTMRAAAGLKSFPWEGLHHDGYADTIESMLYLLTWFDIPECHAWVDEEIGIMFNMQSHNGFVSSTYLDGNFIRTALLYAHYKTQGIMINPWRNDVYIGAAFDKNTDDLYLFLYAHAPWEGQIKFDTLRHKDIWKLPIDYPRLNATPEWFTVVPQQDYSIIDIKTGRKIIQSGQNLADGIAVNLNENNSPMILKISLSN